MISYEATSPKIIASPLKGKVKFDKLFASGRRFNSADLSAVVKFNGIGPKGPFPNGKYEFRFAVIVPKRNAKRAVLRNRIKRLLRESVRKATRDKSLGEGFLSIDNIAFLWRNAPPKPGLIRLAQAELAVGNLLNRIFEFAKRNQRPSNNEGAS